MNLLALICALAFGLNHPSFSVFPAGSHHQETTGEHCAGADDERKHRRRGLSVIFLIVSVAE